VIAHEQYIVSESGVKFAERKDSGAGVITNTGDAVSMIHLGMIRHEYERKHGININTISTSYTDQRPRKSLHHNLPVFLAQLKKRALIRQRHIHLPTTSSRTQVEK
jgi:hypothetical protein